MLCCRFSFFLPLQTFAEDPKLLVLLAQLLQQELGATLAALPATELSSNSDRQQQLRAAAKDVGIATADSWDLGGAAVGHCAGSSSLCFYSVNLAVTFVLPITTTTTTTGSSSCGLLQKRQVLQQLTLGTLEMQRWVLLCCCHHSCASYH
jgi:hypothetical protein